MNAAESDVGPSRKDGSEASASAFACSCCAVWEVVRGPHAGERVVISSESTTPNTVKVGRQSQCWLRLRKDLEVSGLHAEVTALEITGKHLTLDLVDRKSTNGSRINGELLVAMEKYTVDDQDLVQFGRSVVRVRFGSTQCAAATATDKQQLVSVEDANLDEEPIVEPPPTSDNTNADRRIQHDEDVFEAPTARLPPPLLSIQEPRIQHCVVCGVALHGWSVLEQQLHVNACLDGNADANSSSATRHAPRPSSAATTVVATGGNGRKRKRATRPKDEELAVALAMSKSMVDEEQTVDMHLALVSGELAEVDAQLKRLNKKRAALVKKLEKLEKHKRRIHKGDVQDPAEVRILFDWNLAKSVVFPEHRLSVKNNRGRRQRTSRLTTVYQVERETDSNFVGMWRRAAQPGASCDGRDPEEDGGEDKVEFLYTTKLLRSLLSQAAPRGPSRVMEGTEGMVVEEKEEEEMAVPDVVKRVFHNWQENLDFLRTQSVEDLRNALAEMQQRREDFHDDINQGVNGEADPSTERSGEADGTRREDVGVACAFFEQVISQLLVKKRELPRPPADVEIVEVEDSQESTLTTTDPVLVLIDDLEEEEVKEASPPHENKASDVEEEESAADDNNAEKETAMKDAPTVPEDDAVPEDEDMNGVVSAPRAHNADDGSPSTAALSEDPHVADESTLEHQLLSALRANALLYEAVLLLQPLDLPELLHYVREDAAIKCTKNALVCFCDRHGITFKSGS